MSSLDLPRLHVLTGAEMAALERTAMKEFQLPPAALMERAGYEVARAVRRQLGDPAGARVHVVCGVGNNGGDGLVAARALFNWGARVSVWLVGERSRLSGDPARFAVTIEKMGLNVTPLDDETKKRFRLALFTADCIVDGLVGTGLRGELRPHVAEAAHAINESGRPVIAIDIPSGVEADTGRVGSVAVRARETVTFSLPKVGHLLLDGRSHTGRLTIADIGLPRTLFSRLESQRIWVTTAWAHAHLKPRPFDAHKGTFGRVLIIGGSRGMAGAVALAAKGALRAGAGRVVCFVPEGIIDTVQQLVPEATAVPLPESEGRITADAFETIAASVQKGDALAVGPGLGRSPELSVLVNRIVSELHDPLVVDADALNALAEIGAVTQSELFAVSAPRILTPHPKEAARLLSTDVRRVVSDPVAAARSLSERWNGVGVLKGSPTLICSRSGTLYINGSGDVALATAGTGDVLTGVIASLLAQGYEPDDAAALGVYVHGRAGEMVAAKIGRHGSTAGDVARMISRAFAELEGGRVSDEDFSTNVG